MNQESSRRVSLLNLAGTGFYRTTYVNEPRFDILPPGSTIPGLIPRALGGGRLRCQATAGFEGHVALTDHVDLAPGVRLHGLDNGWLLRPAVGLEWTF